MDRRHEELVEKLKDPEFKKAYENACNNYKPGILSRFFGGLLVFAGNTVYGRKPSYAKFKAVEVIARIPYQSWEWVSYMFLTAMYGDEQKAIRLTHTSRFGRVAQDNETMHVVVMSQIAKREKQVGLFRHYLIPLLFSMFYYIVSAILYAVSRKEALELNYVFESHAYEQYSEFIEECGEEMKKRTVESEFLKFYGRECANEYELFCSIRDDELIHRNESIRRISIPRI